MPEAHVVETLPFIYALFKYVHILLFVYWLGGDAGVFYSSTFVVNEKLTREARLTAFKIFVNLDMLPRYCLALMLTIGGILSEYVGYEHPLWQMAGIVALGPIWVIVIYLVHAREGTAFGKVLAQGDYWFRFVLIFALPISVVYHWVTGPLKPFPWIAAKLLIFSFLIFCGFMIRKKLPPFIEGFRMMAGQGVTPESNHKLLSGLMAVRPYVWAIWAGVALSAFLGVWKPGMA
ncbi:MAG: hypothetical protein DYH20_04815 [Gammaproteobacteria bacterium PRO9]|nr:hypothetical protein [Gammaproteobacteria bacterium PRO9]